MSNERSQFEVIIIGGGIAGAALAYFLAERGLTDVLVLEREEQPGYHSSGRSAAVLVEWDPIPAVQELKVQGAGFLRRPPAGFCEQPLLTASGILVTFREPVWSVVAQGAPQLRRHGTAVELLSRAEVLARVPVLAADAVDGGVLLPEDGHIDVHALLWGYLRNAGRRGVERRCATEVLGIRSDGGRVRAVVTAAGELRARWVVDAAGAWAARVGGLAGAAPIALVPYRRTIVTFMPPDGVDVRGWPFVDCEAQRVYFGPESGGLLLSPMDEEPMEPCDAQADELMIAAALDRLGQVAPTLVPKSVRRTWAGLRTFAPDRVLVVGEDPGVKGFFWLAGQGGCGIETSAAVGQIAADLLLDGRSQRFDTALLSPARFGAAARPS